MSRTARYLSRVSNFPRLLSRDPCVGVCDPYFSIGVVTPRVTRSLISKRSRSFILRGVFRGLRFLSNRLLRLALVTSFIAKRVSAGALAIRFPLFTLPYTTPGSHFSPNCGFRRPRKLNSMVVYTTLRAFCLIGLHFFNYSRSRQSVPNPNIAFRSFRGVVPVFAQRRSVRRSRFQRVFFRNYIGFYPNFGAFYLGTYYLRNVSGGLSSVSLVFRAMSRSVSSLFIFLPLTLRGHLIFFIPYLRCGYFLFATRTLTIY